MNRMCRGHYKSLHNCGQLEGFSLHPYRQSAYKLYYVLAVEAQRYNVHETDTPVSPSPVEIQHEHKCSTCKLQYWTAL